MSGKIISGPAAVLLIAFFFFPWIMVSCQGTAVGEISGYQLAAGVPPESMAGIISAGEMQAEPILFAAPITGIVALILLGITLWKSDFGQNAAWGQIVLATATGLVFLMEGFQLRQNSDPMIAVTPLPALWGSLIALLLLTVGAILDLVLWQRTRTAATAAPPVNLPKQSFPPQPVPRAVPLPLLQTAAPKQQKTPDTYDASLATIVDEVPPASTSTGLSQETIVDDSFGDIGQATIVKTEVLYVKPDSSAKLVIEEGNNQGKQFSLYDNTTIGRVPDNGIVIDDTAMSSFHARIKEDNGRFMILDMDSTNGVYVLRAGQTHWEKQDSCELHDGDKIKLGRTTLLFTI